MIAIFVTIKIKDGLADQFRKVSFGNSEGSVRDEPGCFRFDILESSEDNHTFHLYEVYKNEDAFDAHKNTLHFKKWFSTVEPWFDGNVHSIRMNTVFPSDNGWKKQKPHLLNW